MSRLAYEHEPELDDRLEFDDDSDYFDTESDDYISDADIEAYL